MANVSKRNIPGNQVQDPSAIGILTYSDQAGSVKTSEVGRSLAPLGDGAGGFTTDASTARILPGAGQNLAIYNKSGTVQSVTVSSSGSTTALSIGATNAAGNVGVACTPNSWTYVACNQSNWVVTDSSNLVVYLINDYSSIQAVAPVLVSQPNYPQL